MMELPKEFSCTKCGKVHAFGAYVAAHADEMLTHTCDCGQQHTVKRYIVRAVKPRQFVGAKTSLTSEK